MTFDCSLQKRVASRLVDTRFWKKWAERGKSTLALRGSGGVGNGRGRFWSRLVLVADRKTEYGLSKTGLAETVNCP